MTSNGVGMGHLSRQVTTALSGPHGFDAVILSLSRALPRVMAAAADGQLPGAAERGIRFEYAPSWESGWYPTGWRAPVRRRWRSYRWMPYLRDRVVSLVAETGASAVVFDGVAPYPGLVQARELLPSVGFAWVRRGLWHPGAPARRLDLSRHFDITLEPGDVASAADRGPTAARTDAVRIPAAVSMTDVLAPASREQARAALGLPPDRPVLLLAPGAGASGSVDDSAREVLAALAAHHPDWAVAVTRQAIARHRVGVGGAGSPRVHMLEDVYPLARYLSAFDAAVSAAGYNAVHELLAAQVPTLLVPNTAPATDDQVARAEGAARRGVVLCAQRELAASVQALLGDRETLRSAMAELDPPTGGRQIADRVLALAASGAPPGERVPLTRPSRPWVDLRTAAPAGSARAVLTTQELTAEMLRGERPVEHLLPGSSDDYLEARARSVGWIYRT